MDVIELTKQLLNIPSPSGNENAVGQFLWEKLGTMFDLEMQPVGDRFNILATNGFPKILFTTHIDTVPKQLEVKEDDEYLYGRGACDTKGIIASMLCACEEASNLGLKDFAILFDVGEESDFCGIKKAIDSINPEFVVVGEPTDFKAVIGQKGLIGIKIKCFGKSAPGSIPEKGVSAIDMLLSMLDKIKKISLPEEDVLGKTTLNIGQIRGGSAPNVVSDYAEAMIEIRSTRPNAEILDSIFKELPKENFIVEYSFEPTSVLDMGIMKELAFDTITVSYFTEMYFWAKKAKTIVFGPGQYEFAHTDDEKIRKADLEKAKQLYLEMIKLVN